MAAKSEEKCQKHPELSLKYLCSTCKRHECKECINYFGCLTHDIRPRDNAESKELNEILEVAEDAKWNLEKVFKSLVQNKTEFEAQVNLCRDIIEVQTKKIKEKIDEKSQKLIKDLEKLSKKYYEGQAQQLKELDSKKNEMEQRRSSVIKVMADGAQGNKNLTDYRMRIKNLQKDNSYKSFLKDNSPPQFIPSTWLENALQKSLDIGKIATVNTKQEQDDMAELAAWAS